MHAVLLYPQCGVAKFGPRATAALWGPAVPAPFGDSGGAERKWIVSDTRAHDETRLKRRASISATD